MSTEVAASADFSQIRYAQCWEDADVLLEGLDIQPGDTCLAIASAGDNALAMLTRTPRVVYAIDLNPAQLACVALRIAAYRALSHGELLILVGSREEEEPLQRRGLFEKCRPYLPTNAAGFWKAHQQLVDQGIGAGGKFERYFALFRKHVLPLVHSRRTIDALLAARPADERRRFYQERWNTWRWRLLFRIFFSRFVMGRLGRDPSFFRYVEGNVAEQIRARAEHALTVLAPAENPYLQWILLGRHGAALPTALRAENFELIRSQLDRIAIRCEALEDFLDGRGTERIARFNLSDIFEYMAPDRYESLLNRLITAGASGGRLAYWNMLAPRRRPAHFSDRLRSLDDEAKRLHTADNAFFYSAFVLEEII